MRLIPRRSAPEQAIQEPSAEERSLTSISDPHILDFFGINANYSREHVSESTALGLSAFYRAVCLISQTLASLPLRTLREEGDGTRKRVSSFLDDPGGPGGVTTFEWVETVMAHLLIHGNAFLAHVYNGAGARVGLTPIHPLAVAIEVLPDGTPLYRVTLVGGEMRTFTPADMTHIPSISLDGVRGLSLIGIARNSLGTGIAGDKAAARQFANGMMVGGLVTPDEDVSETQAKEIKRVVDAKLAGTENAGEIVVMSHKLKFTQMAQMNADAQFLESRQFQIEDVARWTGVPPFALMQTEKQTSWGTGIESQQRGLARTVLAPWAHRVEQRLSRLLASTQWVEFDFAGLERATPVEEIRLLVEQVRGGLLTRNEARAIRNLPPVPGGDELATDPQGVATPPGAEEAL